MKEIPLTKGYVALVSDGDYIEVSKYKWRVQINKHTQYAVRWAPGERSPKRLIALHRWLLGITDSDIVGDHIDGNGLNNQRENIRAVSTSHNIQRARKAKGRTSKYCGVFIYKRTHTYVSTRREYVCVRIKKTWAMSANINKKPVKKTGFDSEIAAARYYNEIVLAAYGPHARINIIDDTK